MKKLLIACLVIVVIGAIGIATASYFAYRAASPYLQQASDYVSGLKALPELEQKIAEKSSYKAPANGELTAQQVERFARVQERVRQNLGTRIEEIEKKHSVLKSNETPSPSDALAAMSAVLGLFIDARRYQVDALNVEKFSQSEYDWVRARVCAAAGMQFTSAFDLRKIEEMARSGQERVGLSPNFDLPEVPARNRELVKPHMDDMEKWLPLAFFGL
jgi:hypothetical protein